MINTGGVSGNVVEPGVGDDLCSEKEDFGHLWRKPALVLGYSVCKENWPPSSSEKFPMLHELKFHKLAPAIGRSASGMASTDGVEERHSLVTPKIISTSGWGPRGSSVCSDLVWMEAVHPRWAASQAFCLLMSKGWMWTSGRLKGCLAC